MGRGSEIPHWIPSQDQEKSKENQWSPGWLRAGWPVQKVQNLPGHWKSSKKSINPIKCLRDFFIFFIKPSETFSISYKIFQILALGLLGSGSAGSGPAGPGLGVQNLEKAPKMTQNRLPTARHAPIWAQTTSKQCFALVCIIFRWFYALCWSLLKFLAGFSSKMEGIGRANSPAGLRPAGQ